MTTTTEHAQLKIRLPVKLKEWLAMQAGTNHRSLNSELVKLLEDTRRTEEGKQAVST